MNTSLSWIKAYVPELDVTAQEFTDAMTLSGSKVEGFTKMDADLEKIVIGQIQKIERHPDAEIFAKREYFFAGRRRKMAVYSYVWPFSEPDGS